MESGSPAKFAVDNDIGGNPMLAGTLALEKAQAFSHEIAQEEARDRWDWLLSGIIIIGFALLVYEVYRYAAFDPLLAAAEEHQWTRFIVRPTILWTIMGTVLLGFRTIFWLRYRPFPSANFENAPNITVIIPAYNEGAMVMKAIESVALALYP
ncbi:MAG: glycosyltransferase, partial [Candidatus Dormiibacterota bacterium]